MLLCRGGANLAFGFIYAIHLELFPAHFMVQSYGISNFFCRSITMFSPILAEIDNKYIPLFSMVGINLLACVGSMLLVKRVVKK